MICERSEHKKTIQLFIAKQQKWYARRAKGRCDNKEWCKKFWSPTLSVKVTRHYLMTHLKAAKGTITRVISEFAYHFQSQSFLVISKFFNHEM